MALDVDTIKIDMEVFLNNAIHLSEYLHFWKVEKLTDDLQETSYLAQIIFSNGKHFYAVAFNFSSVLFIKSKLWLSQSDFLRRKI